MTDSTGRAADAERLAQYDIKNGCQFNVRQIECWGPFLRRQLDTALRDAEALRAEFAKDQEARALIRRGAELVRTSDLPYNRIATLEEEVEALREEVGRLRARIGAPYPVSGLECPGDGCRGCQYCWSGTPILSDRQNYEYIGEKPTIHELEEILERDGNEAVYIQPDGSLTVKSIADTKSLRHPLTGDTACPATRNGRCTFGYCGEGRCYIQDCATPNRTGRTGFAARDDDVEQAREIYLKWMKDNKLGDKLIEVEELYLIPAYAAALTAVRLSGRAEMAKLDEPEVEVMARAYDPLGWSWFDRAPDDHPAKPLFLTRSMEAMKRALATRDAALKTLPDPE